MYSYKLFRLTFFIIFSSNNFIEFFGRPIVFGFVYVCVHCSFILRCRFYSYKLFRFFLHPQLRILPVVISAHPHFTTGCA